MLAVGIFAAAGSGHSATFTINTSTLNSKVGVHPRLLLDAATVAALRADIESGTNPNAAYWGLAKSEADGNAVSAPTPAPTGYPIPASDRAQLGQRANGSSMANLGFAYLMTKDSPAARSIWMEAEESMTPFGTGQVMQVTSYPTASSGRSIEANGSWPVGSVGAQYALPTLTASGTYKVWVRYATNSTGTGFQVKVDNQPAVALSFPSATSTWTWADAGTVTLTPGNHVLSILYGTQWVRIDKILVTNESAYASTAPSGTGAEQHWLEAWNSTITAPASVSVATIDQVSASKKHLTTLTDRSSAPSTPDTTRSFTIGGSGGTYDVWVRWKSNYSTNNGNFFSINSGTPTAFSMPGSKYMEWYWQKVASSVSLSAGGHTLNLSSKMAGAMIDRFLVTTAGAATPVDPNKYIVGMMNYAFATCSYATWGTQPNFIDNDGTDLAAGHQLFGLALAYDWGYSDMSPTDRQTLYDKLYTFGLPTMYTGSVSSGNWVRQYLLNRYFVDAGGLGAGAMAIYGDNPAHNSTVLTWLTQSVSKFGDTANALNETVGALMPDGANQEGIGYYEYGLSFLLQYTAMARAVLGVDGLDDGAWFQQTPLFRLALSLPMNAWVAKGTMTSVDFGDSNRAEWNGSGYLLRRLAALTKGSTPTIAAQAQWLATQLDTKNANSPAGQWLNMLWNDPTITPVAPTDTNYYFSDYDFVLSRSSWSGSESLLAYQCGPFIGHRVQAREVGNTPYIDRGGGHAHPAANNFVLFGSGEWLLRNTGYTEPKYTRQSNTLLVDGAGQLGEGGAWMKAADVGPAEDVGGILNPAINAALCFSTAPFDYAIGDARKAYPASKGVTQFTRRLLFYKPDVLVAVDDVALSATKPLEMRFFTEQQTVTTVNSSTYTTTGPNAKLMLHLLTEGTGSSDSTFGTDMQEMIDNSDVHLFRRYVKATPYGGSSANWVTASAFTWSAAGGSPKQVTLNRDDANVWKFKVGGTNAVMVLNRVTATGYGVADQAHLVTVVEAEIGTFPGATNMQTYTDATASGGSYVSTKATITGTPSPDIAYSILVPVTSLSATPIYTLWARCKAQDGYSDSFYHNVDGAANTQVNVVSPYNVWKWVNMGPITPGAHTLNILHREANCKIDEFAVTDDAGPTLTGIY